MRTRLLLFLSFVSLAVLAQTAAANKAPAKSGQAAGAAPAQQATPATVERTGIDAIIELVKANMSEALVIKTIQRQGKPYDLTLQDLLKLQKAGVSQKIIETMLDPTSTSSATPAPPAGAAALAAPAATTPANEPAAYEHAPANPAQANASALPANQPGRSYYCTFNDTVQRPNVTHYFSGVFQADASQIEVSKAWTNYIRQTYLPGDNRDNGSCPIGTADQQQRVETALRQTWQVMATGSERAGRRNTPTNTVVDVSWKYVPDHPSASSAAGTPHSTAAASVAPPAYTASAATAAKPPVATAAGQGGAAGAQGRWFYCYNTVPMPPMGAAKQFVSSVFQSNGDPDSISRVWDIYIAKKYAPLNQKELLDPNTYHSPHCSAGLQGALQDLHDRAVKGSANEVDWKYTPDQAASAATAAQPPAAAAGQSAPAQTQKQQGEGWWWYCSARNTAGRRYMTGVFFYPADIRGSYGTGEINTAWANYIQSKYPTEHLSVECQLGGADQAATQRFYDGEKASYKGGQVVDVDWKYAPTPVASGKGNPYYCFAYNVNKTLYFSDTFEVPPNTPSNLVFFGLLKFLAEKYGLSAQSGWDGGACSWGDKAKQNVIAGYKIIETGWKPTTLPSPKGSH